MKLSDVLTQDNQIVIDGKTYTFSDLHLNAQAAIEEKYGIALLGLMEGVFDEQGDPVTGFQHLLFRCQTDTSTMRFVAWQLLRKYHRDITEEDVGYMITLENQLQVLKTIIICITRALPLESEKKREMLEIVSEIRTTGL